jgi:hypothetical protein
MNRISNIVSMFYFAMVCSLLTHKTGMVHLLKTQMNRFSNSEKHELIQAHTNRLDNYEPVFMSLLFPTDNEGFMGAGLPVVLSDSDKSAFDWHGLEFTGGDIEDSGYYFSLLNTFNGVLDMTIEEGETALVLEDPVLRSLNTNALAYALCLFKKVGR